MSFVRVGIKGDSATCPACRGNRLPRTGYYFVMIGWKNERKRAFAHHGFVGAKSTRRRLEVHAAYGSKRGLAVKVSSPGRESGSYAGGEYVFWRGPLACFVAISTTSASKGPVSSDAKPAASNGHITTEYCSGGAVSLTEGRCELQNGTHGEAEETHCRRWFHILRKSYLPFEFTARLGALLA